LIAFLLIGAVLADDIWIIVYCAKLAMDFSKMASEKPRNDRSG
jgi:hypothetical protein